TDDLIPDGSVVIDAQNIAKLYGETYPAPSELSDLLERYDKLSVALDQALGEAADMEDWSAGAAILEGLQLVAAQLIEASKSVQKQDSKELENVMAKMEEKHWKWFNLSEEDKKSYEPVGSSFNSQLSSVKRLEKIGEYSTALMEAKTELEATALKFNTAY